MSDLNKEILQQAANQARGLAIDAVHACSSGHLGLPLGAAEIGAALFGHSLSVDPGDPDWLKEYRQANWKLYLEVGMENLHIPFVHRASIGKQALSRVKTAGEWQCLEMEGAGTASLPRHLRGELKNIESLDRKVTRFCLVYPNLFIVATIDSVWWAQTWPVSPEKCVVKFGFCVSVYR